MTYDSWQNQGRQRHGWFGHGTSPHDDKPDRSNPPALDSADAARLGTTRSVSTKAAVVSADYRPPRNAYGGVGAAPIIKASVVLGPPAMMEAGATPAIAEAGAAAAELVAAAVASGLVVPLAVLAVALLAGWGLYELMPGYDSLLIHEVELSGHPEIAAVMDETQRKVAFAIPGPPGKPASVVVWDLKIPLPSPFSGGQLSPVVVDRHGQTMGTYYLNSRTILLTEAGDKTLQEAAEHGGGATEPQNGEEKVSSDKRNRDLPEQLWTRKGFREAVIANDKPLTEAIEEEKISDDSVRVHHIIPQASVRKDQELFLAGEWQPDRLDNGIALPKNPDVKKKFDKAIKEERPSHGGRHQKWTEEVNVEIKKMKEDLDERKLKPGDPGYAPAVKEGLTRLLQRLREKLLTRQKVMIDQPHPGVA